MNYEVIECNTCKKHLGFYDNGCDDYHKFYCGKEECKND